MINQNKLNFMEVINTIEVIVNLSLIIGVSYVFIRVVKAENKKQNQ